MVEETKREKQRERNVEREREREMSNVFGFRDRFLFFIFLTGEIGLECNK